MKKILLSALLCGSLFAQNISIDKNSEAGKIILNADKEYKEYLIKLAEKGQLVDVIYQQEMEIRTLKQAVAKLIKENAKVNFPKETNAIAVKADSLAKTADALGATAGIKDECPLHKMKMKETKCDAHNNEMIKNGGFHPDMNKGCDFHKKHKNFDPEKMKQLKKDFKESVKEKKNENFSNAGKLKEYSINTKKLNIYSTPNENSITEVELNRGEKIIVEKFTKEGWVKIKDGGWVKGYLLYPTYLPTK